MQTSPDGPRRTPPVPALLAAPLALVTALAVGFFSVLAVAFSNGQFDDGGWLVVLVPTVLAVGLVLGVILLLLGRSWLVLTVLAGARRPAGGTNPPLTGLPRGPSSSRSPASYQLERIAPIWSGGTGPS